MADDFSIDLALGGLGNALSGIGKIAGAVGGIGGGALGGSVLAAVASAATRAAGALVGIVSAALATSDALRTVNEAAKTLTTFASAQWSLGSSMGTVGALRAVGRGIGADTLAAALELHARSISGGIPTGIAVGMGLRINPNDLAGFTDRGQELLKFMQVIDQELARGQFEKARIQVNELAPSLANFLNFTHDMRLRMIEAGKAEAALFTPDRVQSVMEFHTQLGTLGTKLEGIATIIGSDLLPGVNLLLGGLNSAAGWFEQNMPKFFKGNVGLQNPQGIKDAAQSGLNRNTQELRDLNNTIRDLKYAIGGGGPRTRTAIPAAFGLGRGYAIQGELQADAVKLGAYSVAL